MLKSKNSLVRIFKQFSEKIKKTQVPEKDSKGSSEPFIPYNQLTDEIKKKRLEEDQREKDFYFGSPKNLYASKVLNQTEFFAKAMRNQYLVAGDFPQHKHIIPVKRLRTTKDTLAALIKNHESPCLLKGREEFPDFDFIADKSHTRRLDK